MIFGYHANGLPDRTPDEVVELLDEAGYGSVALPIGGRWFDPRQPGCQEELDRFAELLCEKNFSSIIEIEPDEGALILTDTKQRRNYLKLCEYAIDTAATLRSDCVVLRSGVLTPGPDEEGCDPEAAWEQLINGLAELLEYADERDVLIGFEPTYGMLVDTTDAFNRLLGRLDSGRLRLSLDLATLCFMGEQPLAHYLHIWSGRLVNLYFCDVKKGDTQLFREKSRMSPFLRRLKLGEGELDFAPLFHALDDTGYAGGIHVRFDDPPSAGDGLEEMHQAIRFLRQAARL
ncbi:MAG: sugar phosphate isomerase/epimerase [Planctomycetia bacterium]|jgi:sugar phosphate isomerase/epimerase